MIEKMMFALILVPAVAGILALTAPAKMRGAREFVGMVATVFNLFLAIALFGKECMFTLPWAGAGLDFSLRLYHFSSFIILASAGFSFLICMYSTTFMDNRQHLNQFYSYLLLTVAMVNGAALADNLVVMLFFWEGLILTLFGMIIIGHKGAYKTAIKAFIISGVTDLCLLLGIGMVYYITGTMKMSDLSIPLTSTIACTAFVLMMIGAISKAGSMPFHSWIPDAAVDAPLPFMAFLPAALEKLLGIYLLARISLDIFQLTKDSWISSLMMTVGALTILFAVMMALIQKDYKKLLSYHAISQVGYMILGIGTAVPVGIVGGIFHMINHAMYKSCLFLTGGSVEKQTGTTDLNKLGGIGKYMPVTFVCFIVAAAAISGVPPLNGFFSKELVYDGALERHWIFYAAALLGSFLTAASFLKLGHSAFLGKESTEVKNVKEAPMPMLVPMFVIAGFCVLFGLWNALPLQNLIQPILGQRMEGHDYSGLPHSVLLVVLTLVALAAALANHMYGVKKSGKPIGASDHIHHAPGLSEVYDAAEKGLLDPYNIGMNIAGFLADILWRIDRAVDWLYDNLTVESIYDMTSVIKEQHNGKHSTYILWSLIGLVLILIYFGMALI